MVIFPNSDCVGNMDLILAIDLMDGLMVHGKKGMRDTYAPLEWGLASSPDPVVLIRELEPRYIYIADLDRIKGSGANDAVVTTCARNVERCYVDRGCRSPQDYLETANIVNIVGTETGGADLSAYKGGLLSVDIKDGAVIPGGDDPLELLKRANEWDFEGCIVLNLGSVGTAEGVGALPLEELRSAYAGFLIYGGGVSSVDDLYRLRESGFDGAIVATAVHSRRIPVSWVQEGSMC